MQWIKKIVKSSLFVPFIIIILISILVWFTGPYFAFAGYYPLAEVSSRITAIVLVLLVFAIFKLVTYHRAAKLQQDMVEDIADDNGIEEVISAESVELKNKFEQAFSILHKKKKGNGNSFTDLPWYMIIGSPGCGKTTLLSNSGLKFPLFEKFSNQAIKGVGGTKNCDWWFTDEAVLLDTAGRYTSRDSHKDVDESGWNNFLKLIKKYRKKPISGVIASFSISDLLTMNEFEIGQQLIQTKNRISELNEFFGTKLPVYIILTKCDMLAGFNEFYESFSHKEREQTFGITFDYEKNENNVAEQFSFQFDELMKSLSRRQWPRMELERDNNRKFLIYSYTNQLASLKENLQNLVEHLSTQDSTSTNGIVRGLYFTSGTQQGAPIDRIMANFSQQFGLKSTAQVMWNNDSRSYFITDLLQKVIFPESEQFGVLAGYKRRKGVIAKSIILAASVVTLSLLITWYISYQNNVKNIDASILAVKNWQDQYQNSSLKSDIKSYLPALGGFSKNLQLLVEQKEASFSGFGLDQSTALHEAFDASYTRLLKMVLLPYVKKKIENNLIQKNGAKNNYLALKAYLMLGNKERRDEAFLFNWFDNSLNNDRSLTAEDKGDLIAHFERLVKDEIPAGTLNEQLIANSRRYINKGSLIDLYYQQFKHSYNSHNDHMMTMSQLAGTEWQSVFSTKLEGVSNFYSPETFKEIKSELLTQYITKLSNEEWILGSSNQPDKDKLSRDLIKVYSNDYVKQWKRVLAKVSISEFDSIQGGIDSLNVSSAVDSPIIYLLETVSTYTQLQNEDLLKKVGNASGRYTAKLNRVQKLKSLRASDSPELFISSQFSKLHELMSQDKKLVIYEKMSTIFSKLALELSQLSESNDAFEINKVMEPLRTFAFKQPLPLSQWLGEIDGNVDYLIRKEKVKQIVTLWQQEVMPRCNDLTQSSYPFNKESLRNISLNEMSELFSNSGILIEFFNQNIKSLVNTSSYPWRWKNRKSKGNGLSDAVLRYFELIDRIKSSLFLIDERVPNLSLILKPIFLDTKAAKFEINHYGKRFGYQFGRASNTKITWPTANPDLGVAYTFFRKDGSEAIIHENGPFALFRLLDKANIKKISNNKIEVTLSAENYSAVYEIKAEHGANPLVFDLLSQFQCMRRF
ncbi:type VI secretion system membrane subunit TssM [Colwellia sp. KU-HH00111]|uniref:type VI secretion system membrane subunit TssM n=1 Tax=Colwellia sp. KU-HH00111 TaxID=3127652 RepID=UPI00310A919B